MADSAALYLIDLGPQIMRLAKGTGPTDDFARGRRMALYEVVTLMLSQSALFGLGPEAVGLADVDPERDLLLP
jgi:hypothetical protein